MALGAALALAVKLALALGTYGTNDVYYWERFLAIFQQSGAPGLYHSEELDFFNHPPFMLHALQAMDALRQATGLPFPFWLRLPAILADLGSLLMVWRIGAAGRGGRWAAGTGGGGSRRLAGRVRPAALFLLATAPVSIMISGFHGNTDPVMVFFVLLGVYLLDVRHRVWLAGAAYGMSLDVKVVPLVFLPTFLLYLPDTRRRLAFCAAAGAVVFLASLPYLLQDPAIIAQKVLGYGSFYGYWGVSRLLVTLGPGSLLNRAFFRLGRSAVLGLVVLAALVMSGRLPGALGRARGRGGAGGGGPRPPLFVQCAVIAFLFLAFSPGFGIQYLAWLVPWALAAGAGAAALYFATSGVFAFLVYTHWSGGLPWYFADARPLSPEWWPPSIVVFELLCWISVLAVLWSLLRGLGAAPVARPGVTAPGKLDPAIAGAGPGQER